jgi:hypothetical protein
MMDIHPKVAKNRDNDSIEQEAKSSCEQVMKDYHFVGMRCRNSFKARGSTLPFLSITGGHVFRQETLGNLASTEDKSSWTYINLGSHRFEAIEKPRENYTSTKCNKKQK